MISKCSALLTYSKLAGYSVRIAYAMTSAIGAYKITRAIRYIVSRTFSRRKR